MKTHTLPRTGREPIQFDGEELAESGDRTGDGRSRAIDLILYRTESGKFVVHRIYETEWRGEMDDSTVQVCDDIPALLAFLRDWAPDRIPNIGYPPGAQFEGRQLRMIQTLDAEYRHSVSEVLESLPEAVEILE